MNLGTMKTALIRIAGVDSTDPLVDWINDAYHEVEDAYDWPFLVASTVVTTTIGNATLTGAPADLGKVIELTPFIASGMSVKRAALTYVSPIKFAEKYGYGGAYSTGEPLVYTLSAGVVNLWPIPNQVYSLQLIYRKELVDLAADVDVPGFPTRMHYSIVRGASVPALQAESEEDRADSAQNSFENAIQRHISRYGGNKQSGQFETVRDVMGYGA